MALPLISMRDIIMRGMSDPNSNWSKLMRGEKPPDPPPKQPSRWDKRPDGRNVAHQYRPGFFTGFGELEDIPFDTLDELMDIEWVKSWTKTPSTFARFSISRDEYAMTHNQHLMAEMTNGSFWVVALFDHDVPELPTWEPPAK